ncbi:unnamed protein product [Effrenium voratum]|nr:unnamed protein product [Effrenium voratum]
MLEQLQSKAKEKFLLEALDEVDILSAPSVGASKLGGLEYGRVVLARDLRDGWARLHEDEVWAAGIEEKAFVLADGRSLGLARPMRYLGTDVQDWPFFEALQCAELNGASWAKIPGGLKPKPLVDLAWLSSWHSPDGTILEAPPLHHDDHRHIERPLPRLCVASMVRGSPPAMIESLILQHHANGFEKVVLYFDRPDEESLAVAAVERFAKPLPTGPNGLLCKAVAVRCTEQWWEEVRKKSRYYLREDEALELYRETAHLDAHIKDVQARQMLCIEHALFEAQREGFEWVLHVDSDEILFFPDQERHKDARRFFLEVPLHFSALRFANLEAVPESLEVADPFEEVSLFKMNPMLLEELGVEPRFLSSGEVAEEDEDCEPDLFSRRHADSVPGSRAHGYVRLPRRERHALRRLLAIMHEIAAKRNPVLESLQVRLPPIESSLSPSDDSSDDESCHGPRPYCPAYFNSYSNGKCAVRTEIGPRGELPPLPAGVHGFLRDGGMSLYTLACKGPGAPVVLHYANCGFSSWRQKYQLLCRGHGTEDGAFSVRRPGIAEIRSHLATRQLALGGKEEDLERFYRSFVLGNDFDELAFLAQFGLLLRISAPQERLREARRIFQEFVPDVPRPEPVFLEEEPGIGELENSSAVSAQLQRLVAAASNSVPLGQRPVTPLALRATRAVEDMSLDEVDALMQQMKQQIASAGFKDAGVQPMSGSEEAVAEWLSINVLMGCFTPGIQGAWAPELSS